MKFNKQYLIFTFISDSYKKNDWPIKFPFKALLNTNLYKLLFDIK